MRSLLPRFPARSAESSQDRDSKKDAIAHHAEKHPRPFLLLRGYRQKQKESSGPRGAADARTFTPVIDGYAFTAFFVAFVTFGYFFVQYRLVSELLVPSVLGFLELIGGLSAAAVLVKLKVDLSLFGALTGLLAGMATAIVFALEFFISAAIPASGQSAPTSVVINPFSEVLWYYSQGVAESYAWVLFAFSSILKATGSFSYALAIASFGFMIYHLGVVNLVYLGNYWASLPFLTTIFVANVVWCVFFYFRPRLGEISWSHGLLNVVVTVLGLLGLVAISFTGVHLPAMAGALP